MNYNIIEDKNKVILEGVSDFEPVHIFECGQCFRWNKEDDGSFTGVALDRILNVKKEEDKIIFSNTNIDDFNYIWYDYFDLDRDYGKIKKELSKDDAVLDEAVKFGSGIRILNQEPFETTISFIISANNRIPRIKKSIELISERYGSFLGEYNGKKYYSFPQKEELSKVTVEELEDCKVGFRAKYIIAASKAIANGEIDIYNLKNLSTEEAREILMTLKGVGPKVSNCILLFSIGKHDSFPVDVWVKRVMEYFYLKEDTNEKLIQKYGEDKFGNLSGFAQQYLFYYARELGIGK
ncbi:DNA-3-methyladenine glycosylase family protein [Sporanaerobacter acetigenes]|uniref:DNA-(apurinic or apyrimidinic site) lyase n=1 Tax=Sporanaerobacter acetigenes DSM 13106 TaxID=1123281 RepID=A0A1M5SCU5_9FIRM|nr:DNA glycosylase [Sporanaerobacter acetigenes]SHH36108.1 N-glycosylase/DNA lyase [Sporanaerobacter acetigenes DSM 13106]